MKITGVIGFIGVLVTIVNASIVPEYLIVHLILGGMCASTMIVKDK